MALVEKPLVSSLRDEWLRLRNKYEANHAVMNPLVIENKEIVELATSIEDLLRKLSPGIDMERLFLDQRITSTTKHLVDSPSPPMTTEPPAGGGDGDQKSRQVKKGHWLNIVIKAFEAIPGRKATLQTLRDQALADSLTETPADVLKEKIRYALRDAMNSDRETGRPTRFTYNDGLYEML